jgi:hypothetical protein
MKRAFAPHLHRANQSDFARFAPQSLSALESGGKGEIRTHGQLSPSAVFKTAALNRSATFP